MLKSHSIAILLVLTAMLPAAPVQAQATDGGTAGEPIGIPIVVAPPATPDPPGVYGADPQNTGIGDVGGNGFFQLPNFIGDTREEDSHYNTMHQYPFQPWSTYQNVLTDYVNMARQAGAVAYPPPPYSQYNYVAGDMTVGPGGPVPPPAGSAPTFVSGSSGVSVNPNNGDVTGVAAAQSGSAATTSVTGTVLSPQQFNSAPGLVGQ